MFSTKKTNSRAELALIEKRLDDFVFELKKANRPNEIGLDGLSVLQRAAGLGSVKAVIWLLYAGADVNAAKRNHKTPLYMAAENGHWLVAQILMLCGAKKSDAIALAVKNENKVVQDALKTLTLDTDIFCGLVFWLIKNYYAPYQHHLLNLIIPQTTTEKQHIVEIHDEEEVKESDVHLLDGAQLISQIPLALIQEDLYGLSELAAKNNFLDLANAIIQLNQQKIRTRTSAATVSYWAAKSNSIKLNPLVNNNDGHVILTLQQLYESGNRNLFHEYKKSLTLSQRELYKKMKKSMPEENLTPSQNQLYDMAKFSYSELFENAEKEDDLVEYHTVAEFSLQKSNYVATDALLEFLKSGNSFLANIVTMKNRKMLFLALFSMDLYLFEIGLTYPDQLFPMLQVLGNNFQHKGLFHQIVADEIFYREYDKARPAEKNLQKLYLSTHVISKEQFISTYFKSLYLHDDRTSDHLFLENLSRDQAQQLAMTSRAFGLDLSEHIRFRKINGLEGLPKDVLNHMIFEYLTPHEKNAFSITSKANNDFHISTRLMMINAFNEEFAREMKKMPFFSHRRYTSCEVGAMVLLMLEIVSTVIGAYFASKIFQKSDELYAEMKNMHFVNQSDDVTCTSLCRIPNNQNYITEQCQIDCDYFKHGFNDEISKGVFAIVIPLVAIVLTVVPSLFVGKPFFIEFFKALLEGQSRFYPLLLSAFSEDFQRSVTRIFQSLDPGFQLENSSLKEILIRVDQLEKNTHATRSRYRMFKDNKKATPIVLQEAKLDEYVARFHIE